MQKNERMNLLFWLKYSAEGLSSLQIAIEVHVSVPLCVILMMHRGGLIRSFDSVMKILTKKLKRNFEFSMRN